MCQTRVKAPNWMGEVVATGALSSLQHHTHTRAACVKVPLQQALPTLALLLCEPNGRLHLAHVSRGRASALAARAGCKMSCRRVIVTERPLCAVALPRQLSAVLPSHEKIGCGRGGFVSCQKSKETLLDFVTRLCYMMQG